MCIVSIFPERIFANMCRLRFRPATVRLKITRRVSDNVDGVDLSHFQVGEVYEVGTGVGSYLLALGAAIPADDGEPGQDPGAPILPRAPRPGRTR